MSEIVIALIGALVGAVLGIFGTALTLRFNYRQLYAETVSSNRNEWRYQLREFIATMLSEAYECAGLEKSKTYYLNRNQVLSRLNLKEPLHKMMEHLIYELDKVYVGIDYKEHFLTLQQNIIDVSQKLLKLEWETVKKEAKGG